MAGRQELVFAPLGGVGEIGMNLALYGLGEGGELSATFRVVEGKGSLRVDLQAQAPS